MELDVALVVNIHKLLHLIKIVKIMSKKKKHMVLTLLLQLIYLDFSVDVAADNLLAYHMISNNSCDHMVAVHILMSMRFCQLFCTISFFPDSLRLSVLLLLSP